MVRSAQSPRMAWKELTLLYTSTPGWFARRSNCLAFIENLLGTLIAGLSNINTWKVSHETFRLLRGPKDDDYSFLTKELFLLHRRSRINRSVQKNLDSSLMRQRTGADRS